MSTAQIRTRYFKPFVVSCAVHWIFLCPFFMLSKRDSRELSTIAVNLSAAKSKATSEPGTPLQKPTRTKKPSLQQGPRKEGWGKPQSSTSDLTVRSPTTQATQSTRSAQKASVVESHKPLFVARALYKGIEGVVDLDVKVGKNGKVTLARVRKSLGYGLDEESLNAIYKFKFEPARDADGNPIDDELIYRFKFEINDSSG